MIRMVFPVYIQILLIVLQTPVQDPGKMSIGCKSGIIEYKFTGIQEGVGILQFDDFGKRLNFFRDIVENGKRRTETIMLCGTGLYVFEPGKNADGIKMSVPQMAGSGEESHPCNLLFEISGITGLAKSGEELFLGKNCEVFCDETCRAFMWNGLMLKLELTGHGGILCQEATSIKTDLFIDPEVFRIPDGIIFIENPGNRYWNFYSGMQ